MIESFVTFSDILDALDAFVEDHDIYDFNEEDFARLYNVMHKVFKRVYSKLFLYDSDDNNVAPNRDPVVEKFDDSLKVLKSMIKKLPMEEEDVEFGVGNDLTQDVTCNKDMDNINDYINQMKKFLDKIDYSFEVVDEEFLQNIYKKFLSENKQEDSHLFRWEMNC
jgi:hypothetical protein